MNKTVHFFEFLILGAAKFQACLDSRGISWSPNTSISDDDIVRFLLNDRDHCIKSNIEIRPFEPPTTTPARSWAREISIA